MLKNEPDGAAQRVQPVFELPPGLRIATVTGWLAELDRGLTDARYVNLPLATELRQQIRDLTTTARDSHRVQREKEVLG